MAEGVDYLKIVVNDARLSGTQLPTLAPETVAAHDAGLRTIAHIAGARDVAIALDAGIDGLAHVCWPARTRHRSPRRTAPASSASWRCWWRPGSPLRQHSPRPPARSPTGSA